VVGTRPCTGAHGATSYWRYPTEPSRTCKSPAGARSAGRMGHCPRGTRVVTKDKVQGGWGRARRPAQRRRVVAPHGGQEWNPCLVCCGDRSSEAGYSANRHRFLTLSSVLLWPMCVADAAIAGVVEHGGRLAAHPTIVTVRHTGPWPGQNKERGCRVAPAADAGIVSFSRRPCPYVEVLEMGRT
jgi:hypothetical protein